MKKTISMLLVLSLVLGLMGMISFTVFAEGINRITDVNVTGVVDAVVGQTPTTEGITTDAPGVTLTAQWYVYNWERQTVEPFDGTFETGKVYYLQLEMDAQEGYEFDYEVMNYTVNGAAPDKKTLYWSTFADMQLYYIMDGVTVVDALEVLSVPQIAAGDTISDASLEAGIVLPEGAGYTLNSTQTRWVDYSAEHGETVTEAVTVQKALYAMHIALAPKAGYWIDSQNAIVTAPAGVEFSYVGDMEGLVIAEVDFDLREQVQTVNLTGVPTPAVGDPITAEGITVEGGVLDTAATCWYDSNWTPVTGNFADNENYILDIYIKAGTGTYYTNGVTTASINGVPYEGSVYVYGDTTVNIRVEVNFRKEVTEYAEISGLPEKIAVGAATAPEVTLTYGNVDITGVRWVDEEKKAVTAFENGKGYYLEVSLAPADGYSFGDYFNIGGEYSAGETAIAADKASAKAYFYYSLKSRIEKVELTVSGVEMGGNVADVKVTVPADAKYTCEDVVIRDTATWEQVETGTFQDKHCYELEFYLEPAAGCDFAEDLEIVVDGEDNDTYHSNFRYIYIYNNYSFRTKIDKVELTVTEPVVGGNVADSVVKAPEGANYEIAYWWYDTTTGMQVETGTFQDNRRYELSFDFYPKEDYEFSDDVTVTLNGAKPEYVYIDEYTGRYGYGYETWSFLTPIEKVEFPAFPAAKVGDSAQLEITTPAGANYTLMGMWVDMDGNMPEKLEDGKSYLLMYSAVAAEGYEFTEDTVITVDGREYDGLTMFDYGQILVGKAYSFGMKLIDKVELTVTEPAAGEKPGKLELANKDANYSLDMIEWATNTSGDIEADAESFNKFQYGNYYYIAAYVIADEGYAFADDVKFYINGEEVELAIGYNVGTIYMAAHSFGKLEEAKQPQPPVAPGAGGNTSGTGSNTQTGDAAPIAAMMILLFLAAAGMAVVILGRKKLVK